MSLSVTKGKFGRHQWDISVLQASSPWFGVTIYIENWLSTITLAIVKCTFLLMYLEIFRPLKWLRVAIYSGLITTIVVFLAFTIAQLCFLTPKRGESWLEQNEDPRENKAIELSVPLSAIGFGIDVYTFILPIIGVSQLQLSPRRKFGVLLVFMAGLGACLSSSLTIYYKVRLNADKNDTTWRSMIVIITILVEMCIGLTCSAMPSLTKFVRNVFPDFDIVDSLLSNRFFSLVSRSTSSKESRPKFAPTSFPRSRKKRFDSTLKTFDLISESADNLKASTASEEIRDIELGNMKTTKTHIDANGTNEVADDGIHVQRDFEQTWRAKKAEKQQV